MRPDGRRSRWASVLAALRAVAGPTLPLPRPASLSCCPACGRDRIAVVERSQHGDALGLLLLRCAECDLARHVVVTRGEAEALHALHAAHRNEIDRALAVLQRDDVLTMPPQLEEWR
jgi:hypothetical protein